jgi:hypothetical protein
MNISFALNRAAAAPAILVGTARCAVQRRVQRRNNWCETSSPDVRSARYFAVGDIAARCPYQES